MGSPATLCRGVEMDVLWLILFVFAWIALQAWVLPRLGVPT